MACRCHPSIAAVSNHSFYGGRLLDGCTAANRGALLSGLPPVLCLDVRGSQQYTSGSGSASNQAEARAVVQVIALRTCVGGLAIQWLHWISDAHVLRGERHSKLTGTLSCNNR